MPEEENTSSTAQSVYDFIDDPKRLGEIDALVAKHGLSQTPEVEEAMDPILNLVVDGRLQPVDLPLRFEQKLSLSKEKALALAKDVANQLLFPLRTQIPSVEDVVQLWKLEGPETHHDHKEVSPSGKVSANAFVHEEIEKYGLQLPEPIVQKKFERTLAEFIAKKRTREETVELMARPRKVGGLGLDKRASEQLLDGLSDDAKHVPHPVPVPSVPESQTTPVALETVQSDLVEAHEDPEPVAPRPKPLPPRTRVTFPEAKPPVSRETFDPVTIRPEDEAEVLRHEEQLPATPELHDIDSATAEVLKQITAAAKLDEEGKKKLHAIVKTRLKGLRDPYKTRSALESKEGLGWSDGELSQALEVIEDVYTKLEKEGVLKVEQEKQAFLEKRVAKYQRKETDETSASTEVQPRVDPSSSEEAQSPVTSPAPLVLKKKGKMRDVTAPRKLSGPLEELGSMTIADFRRLGSTPEEAGEEVKERIGLLEQESYGRRLAGLSAWRKSPLYQTYVSVVSEAMQGGQSIADVLRIHASSSEEMLTEQEVRALTKLNGTLRV